jgi:hypothetical protein
MGFMHFESTLKPFINMCGVNGKNERRMDPKDQGNLQKRSPTPSQQLFFPFLVVLCFTQKKSSIKAIEEGLALFIVKELVPLSFVEAPFFQRLILRQNTHLSHGKG